MSKNYYVSRFFSVKFMPIHFYKLNILFTALLEYTVNYYVYNYCLKFFWIDFIILFCMSQKPSNFPVSYIFHEINSYQTFHF